MNIKSYLVCLSAFLIVFSISCDRPQKDLPAKININISGFANTDRKTLIKPLDFNSGIIPSTISEIDCLAVLISAPEKNSSRCEMDVLAGEDQFGVYKFGGSRYVANQTSYNWSVDVPVGSDRRLYLIGFKTDLTGNAALTPKAVCENFLINKNYEDFLSDPYLLSTSDSLNLQPGVEKAVQMNAVLDTAKKLDDCEGPAFPDDDSSPSGPPTQFRISYQDLQSSSFSLVVGANQCIGVKIELLDANNQPANNTSNLPVIIRAQLPEIGTFYQTNSSNMGCAGTFLTPVSGDISYTFNVNNNSLVTMFKANAAAANIPFQIIDPAGVLPTISSRAISYDGSAPLGVSYQVYDLYNNRSTYSSVSENPMVVRRHECRPAAITLYSSLGTQVNRSFSGSMWKPLKVRAYPNMTDVDFYTSYSNCVTETGASADLSLAVPNGTFNFTSIPFAYRVRVSSGNTFSLQVSNDPSAAAPVLLNGAELLSTSNFWRSSN